MNHATCRLAAGAAVIALTVGACGSAGTSSSTAAKTPAASASPSATATRPATNGLEKMSATAVPHETIGMFSLARSVRVQGTMTGEVPAGKFDLRYEGSKLYVADRSPYPVRFDVTGNGGGRRDFSQYGTQFHITAPKNAQ